MEHCSSKALGQMSAIFVTSRTWKNLGGLLGMCLSMRASGAPGKFSFLNKNTNNYLGIAIFITIRGRNSCVETLHRLTLSSNKSKIRFNYIFIVYSETHPFTRIVLFDFLVVCRFVGWLFARSLLLLPNSKDLLYPVLNLKDNLRPNSAHILQTWLFTVQKEASIFTKRRRPSSWCTNSTWSDTRKTTTFTKTTPFQFDMLKSSRQLNQRWHQTRSIQCGEQARLIASNTLASSWKTRLAQ